MQKNNSINLKPGQLKNIAVASPQLIQKKQLPLKLIIDQLKKPLVIFPILLCILLISIAIVAFNGLTNPGFVVEQIDAPLPLELFGAIALCCVFGSFLIQRALIR